MDTFNENSVKTWLALILKENRENFSLEILGNAEKSNGFMSDVIFLSLKPINNQLREYDIALKYGKRNTVVRKNIPVKEAFHSEIYMYEIILPTFTRFQMEKGIDDLFDSVPNCYGTFASGNTEMIALGNLRTCGYVLWDITKPLPRKHINLLIREYAKLHAVSIAMQHQNPKEFQELCGGIRNVFVLLAEVIDVTVVTGNIIETLYHLLQSELDQKDLLKWRKLKELTQIIFHQLLDNADGLKVISHGDAWNNNFMFKHAKNGDPVNVKILDWQLAGYFSPVADLSYLLFSSVSKEDIEDLNNMLEFYYRNFGLFSAKLGFPVNAIYSLEQFLDDWKKYSRHGLLRAIFVFKMSVTQNNHVLDVAKVIETGKSFTSALNYDVENRLDLKERAKHVVKYVVENNLI